MDEAAHHLPALSLPRDAGMCSPPSPTWPPGYNVTHTLRHSMVQFLLPDAQLAAQAGKAKKADPNRLPLPGKVSSSLPGRDNVCDGQRGQVFSVFLLVHISRRFFSQMLSPPFLLFTSLSAFFLNPSRKIMPCSVLPFPWRNLECGGWKGLVVANAKANAGAKC